MTVLSLKDSKDPQAKVALARIEQIKSQLNLSSSPMSRQAPKDMAAERAAADFNIEALSALWAGGEKRYNLIKKANAFIQNDPELVVQSPRNFLELSRDEMRELYVSLMLWYLLFFFFSKTVFLLCVVQWVKFTE